MFIIRVIKDIKRNILMFFNINFNRFRELVWVKIFLNNCMVNLLLLLYDKIFMIVFLVNISMIGSWLKWENNCNFI